MVDETKQLVDASPNTKRYLFDVADRRAVASSAAAFANPTTEERKDLTVMIAARTLALTTHFAASRGYIFDPEEVRARVIRKGKEVELSIADVMSAKVKALLTNQFSNHLRKFGKTWPSL